MKNRRKSNRIISLGSRPNTIDDVIEDIKQPDAQMFDSSYTYDDELWTMSFIASERLIALGSGNSNILILNRSLTDPKELKGHRAGILSIAAMNRDGCFVSSSLDGTVKAWDIDQVSALSELNIYPGIPNDIKVNPVKEIVYIAGSDSVVYVWQAFGSGSFSKLNGHSGAVATVNLSNDGTLLVTGSEDSTIRMWNTTNLSPVFVFEGHKMRVTKIAFTPKDERIVSISDDKIVRLWNVKNLSSEFKFEGHTGDINCLGVSTNGFIATGDSDRSLKVWSIIEKTALFSHNQHKGNISSLEILKNNQYIITGSYQQVTISNVIEKSVEITLQGHQKFVFASITSKNSCQMFTISADRTVKSWKIRDSNDLCTFSGHSAEISTSIISANNKIAATGGRDKLIKLWDLDSYCELFTLSGHLSSITHLSFSNDSKYLASTSWEATLKVWSTQTGELVKDFHGHTSEIMSMTTTSNFKLIFTGDVNGEVIFWSFRKGLNVFSFKHKQFCLDLKVSADDQYLFSASADMECKMIDIKRRSEIKTFIHESSVDRIAVASNRCFIVTAQLNTTVSFWDILTGQQKLFPAFIKTLQTLEISLDCRYIVSSSFDGFVYIHMAKDLKEMMRFDCKSIVRSVIIDGMHIAVGCNDGMTHFFNIPQKKQEFRYRCHENSIASMAVTPGYSSYLLTCDSEGAIKLWNIASYIQLLSTQTSNFGLTEATETFDESMKKEFLAVESYINTLNCYSPLFLKGLKQRFASNSLPSVSDCYILLPLGLNMLHIYSYLGLHSHLSKCLSHGCLIKTDNCLNSPLHYALKKDSQKCIEVLLEYIISFSAKPENHYKTIEHFQAIQKDIYSILHTASSLLPAFLESAFKAISNDPELPNSITWFKPPGLITSPYTKIYLDDFCGVCDCKDVYETFVEFRLARFEIDLTHGSKECLKLLEGLANSSNQKIFSTKLVKVIIDYKWRTMKPFVLFLSVVMWVSLIVMLQMLTSAHITPQMYFVYFAINMILLMSELFQLRHLGLKSYLMNIQNIIDLLGDLTAIIWLAFLYFDSSSKYFTWMMVFSNINSGISGFRAFDSTRYYVRLILKATKDVIPFLLIFGYTTVSFGGLYAASIDNPEESSFVTLWKVPFELGLGSFTNPRSFDLEYTYFMVASIVNVVIMLNLLISILGESFNQFQLEASEIDYRVKLESIIELEGIFFLLRTKKNQGFIQYCEAHNAEDQQSELKEVKLEVEKLGKWVQERIEKVENTLDRLGKHNESMEMKMDKLIALIENKA